VVTAVNEYKVRTVTLDPPQEGEVLIQLRAVGVCHSDLSIATGVLPAAFPVVLGHEGAGIVTEIGSNVSNVQTGDHVVLSFVPTCTTCFYCLRHQEYLCETGRDKRGKMLNGTSRVHLDGKEINVFGFLGCMAEYAVVPSKSVVAIDKKISFEKAALVGCGVITGVGAVMKTAKVLSGSSVVIFGAGGVGLSVIQGAKLAGALTIIVVDLLTNKLQAATEFGATHVIDGSKTNAVEEIKKLTDGRGADYSFEVIGIPSVMEQAYQATRRGGTVCIVGIGKYTDKVSFSSLMLPVEAKTIIGCFYGSANFRLDIPMLVNLISSGKLNLDKLITQTYKIDDALQAFDDLVKGKNLRGVIVFP